MEGTPAHLPFTFVRFGGHACKSPGHVCKTINFAVDIYIKCNNYFLLFSVILKVTLKSHNDKTWLNCKEHVY